jgi:nucleoid DNA-binding protein
MAPKKSTTAPKSASAKKTVSVLIEDDVPIIAPASEEAGLPVPVQEIELDAEIETAQPAPIKTRAKRVSKPKVTAATSVEEIAASGKANVNLAGLVQLVEAKTELPITARSVTEALFAVITDLVSNQVKVSVPGFGTFESKAYKEKSCVNPHDRQRMKIPAKHKPKFTAFNDFKKKVQDKAPIPAEQVVADAPAPITPVDQP